MLGFKVKVLGLGLHCQGYVLVGGSVLVLVFVHLYS